MFKISALTVAQQCAQINLIGQLLKLKICNELSFFADNAVGVIVDPQCIECRTEDWQAWSTLYNTPSEECAAHPVRPLAQEI